MPLTNLDGTITGSLSSLGSLSGSISDMAGEITGVITVGGAHDWPEYSGSYEITPGEETQTLATAETVVTDNIIIKPIPANYGLITWDGSVITVS